jgi:hypothetical protein
MEQAHPPQLDQGNISHPLNNALRRLGARLVARLVLAILLGLSGGWLLQLLAPPLAAAYTSRLNLFLVREEGESFESFVQRSEIVARAAVQRSFDADVLMTDVIVTVTGSSQNITIPVLTVSVSRSDWRLKPDIRHWARYYEAARSLL